MTKELKDRLAELEKEYGLEEARKRVQYRQLVNSELAIQYRAVQTSLIQQRKKNEKLAILCISLARYILRLLANAVPSGMVQEKLDEFEELISEHAFINEALKEKKADSNPVQGQDL